MSRRYMSHAVEATRAYMAANLPTFITQVNTEESSTIVAPVVYSGGSVPRETRSPALEVVDDRSDVVDTATNLWDHNLDVNIILKSKDVDLIAHQTDLRRYLSALHLAIRDDGTLDGCVIQAIRNGATRTDVLEDGRLIGAATLELTVRVDEDA